MPPLVLASIKNLGNPFQSTSISLAMLPVLQTANPPSPMLPNGNPIIDTEADGAR